MTATQIKGLFAALLEVQKNAPHLKKDATAKVKTKTGADYSYTYMTLGALLAEVLPVLHANDIVVAQSPAEIVGHPALETKLVHAPSGEELRSITPLVLAAGADSQSWGGAISYARRYALISMLGLSAEDDDGQSARAKPQAQTTQGNGAGEIAPQSFKAPIGKTITAARRKKLDALIDQVEGAGDPPMRRDHIDAWCEKRGITYAAITTNLADELEASLLNLAKNVGVA